MYLLGFAIGPMLLAPLSEYFGRNPVYIITIVLFAIIQIPTALATNIGGLLVLRFIAGFLGSPALATGGASIGDMYVHILPSMSSKKELTVPLYHAVSRNPPYHSPSVSGLWPQCAVPS